MKITKENVQEYLERHKAVLAPFIKTIDAITIATVDAEGLRAKIEKTEESDYKDEKSSHELPVLTTTLARCERQISKLEQQLQGIDKELPSLLDKGGELAGNILAAVYERRLSTVVACTQAFFSSLERCQQLAKQTDICQSATWHLGRFYQMSGYSSREQGIQFAKRIESVLREFLKESPDLMQFLPFVSAAKK